MKPISAESVVNGSTHTIARLLSWLEDDDERARPIMGELYPHTGKAYVVGVTGSPGSGKSTLTGSLTRAVRARGLSVGIVAVDPSSPFTGGALLGDRVRMGELNTDPGVYIRSMATRGFLGGTARATGDVVKVLDASGKNIVIVETVGVGQDEVEIVGIADTVCLVLVPGMGDAIQAMKAGLMEIADIFVINKADHPGVGMLHSEIRTRVGEDIRGKKTDWAPPVVRTIATEDLGIEELWMAIEQHHSTMDRSGMLMKKRKERACQEILRTIHDEVFGLVRKHLQRSGSLDHMVQDLMDRKRDPYSMAREFVEKSFPALRDEGVEEQAEATARWI